MKTFNTEKNVKIEFEGWVVDLFLCVSGNLGLTVERAPYHEDNPSVDIFVDKTDLSVRPGTFTETSKSIEKNDR